MDLSHHTVFITGGTAGIGLGLAEAFHHAGSQVIVSGHRPDRLARVAQQHSDWHVIPGDLADAAQRRALAEAVLQRFPQVDVLINNAGVQNYLDLKQGPAALEAGADEITVNFTAVVDLTARFIGPFLRLPAATVINVTSGLAFMPSLNTPVYSATKAALHTYSLVLRQQLKNTSVRVIEVVPPMVDTELNQAGRERAQLKYRGVSLADYIPSVTAGLLRDDEIIFFGEGASILAEARSTGESRLLAGGR